MGTYIDKAFFLFMGIWMLYFNISVPIDVAYILAGIIILFVSYYFDGRKNYMVMNIVYGIELLAAFIFAKGIEIRFETISGRESSTEDARSFP